MLVHQIQDTEGIVNNAVKLNSTTLIRISVNGPTFSGIQLQLTGDLFYRQTNGGLSQIAGQWLIFGSPGTFYVQRTIISGTLETDPGPGFLQLNATRSYTNRKDTIGVKTTEVFFEISDDVSGVPVIEMASMIFESEVTGTF